jgi:hypothetical protein
MLGFERSQFKAALGKQRIQITNCKEKEHYKSVLGQQNPKNRLRRAKNLSPD